MGVFNCSMFCCTLLYVHSNIAIILMGKRELVALLYLSSWCLVMVERLFLAVPRGCLQFVIVVFPDHTHLLFLISHKESLRFTSLSSLRQSLCVTTFGLPLLALLFTDPLCKNLFTILESVILDSCNNLLFAQSLCPFWCRSTASYLISIEIS